MFRDLLRHVFSALAMWKSAYTFTFCLYRPSSSVREGNLEPCQVFTAHVYSPMNVHGLLYSDKYFEIFKRPYGHLILQLFLLRFLIHLLFAPTITYYFRWQQSYTISSSFLKTNPQGTGFAYSMSSESYEIVSLVIGTYRHHQIGKIMTIPWHKAFKCL